MSLGWFLFILVLVLFLQGRLYARWAFKGLTYERSFNTHAVFAGGEASMVERIRNKKLLILPWLRIESKIDPSLKFSQTADLSIKHDEFHNSIFSLMPYTGITRRHKIICQRRGCYRLDSASLTCGDAFGIKEQSRDVYFDAQLLVYPEILSVAKIPFICRSWMGDITVKRWIVSDPFYMAGIREYQASDPLNRISWKASARLDRLLVNKNDHTANPQAMIYLNVDIEERMWHFVTNTELIEKGISICASIVALLLEEGISAGFASNAHLVDDKENPIMIRPISGKSQIAGILEQMAMLVVERSCTFHTLLESEINAEIDPMDILLVTTFVSQRMQEQIGRLQQKGHSVEVFDLAILDKGGV
ncbi:MAG TPA: DUF58 domain-containing protein [Bacillota bacterium]|nr:DUF58 domain-containing protein [Bacillota bacterium]